MPKPIKRRKRAKRQTKSQLAKKARRQAMNNPPVSSEDVLAIGRLMASVVGGADIPLVGVDKKRIQRVLMKQSGDYNWNKGRFAVKKNIAKAEEEHLAVWARRLVSGDLLAQGYSPAEIARHFNVSPSTTKTDLRSLASWQILAASTEEASQAIAKTLNRLETLQQAAIKDLTNEEVPLSSEERRNIRKEVEDRELRLFDVLKTMGYLRNAEGASPEPTAPTIVFPQPERPLATMQSGELYEFMDSFMEAVRHNKTKEGAVDADYQEVTTKKKRVERVS